MDYQAVHMEKAGMVVYDNECMICMDGSDDDGPKTVVVQRIPHLVSACTCEFLVHEACLREWLSKTPICPICKECLYYNEPRKRKFGDRDDYNPSSISRCIHRFLCCGSSPGSTRND